MGFLETSAAFVANNTHFDHPLLLPEINNYPLNVIIQPTDLPAAGFSGSISLIGTSNNATIVSQTTTYDAGSDTLTTKGIFDFTAFGPLSFTYDATGQFANAVDPATGDPLAGSQSVQASIIVGQVVAEPGTLARSGDGPTLPARLRFIRRNQMRGHIPSLTGPIRDREKERKRDENREKGTSKPPGVSDRRNACQTAHYQNGQRSW